MPYKLDLVNKKILYELDKNARISDSQLAKKVNRSREAVRNRIKKLQDDGIILNFITSINPSKVGCMFFKMYFQLANIPEEREKFYEYFKQLPGLYWFGGNDGVWDFHAAFYAKDVEEFNKLKNKVFTDFRHIIIKRDVGVLINTRQYVKKYLLDHNTEFLEPTMFGDKIEHNKIDDLDKRLLSALFQNARASLVYLSQKLGCSVDIIRNKMKRMHELGIIMQYRIAIDYTKLGYEMFKAFVYFHNLSELDEKKLFQYAKQNNKIVYLIRQLSAWDVELEIMAKSYEEFNEIINDIRHKFAEDIRNYEFALMRDDIWSFENFKLLV